MTVRDHTLVCSRVQVSYDGLVIQSPMDLQSMLRKAKQKAYKSKREFQDDLELIWSNCYTYNSGEVSSNLMLKVAPF